jgi:hypothetical protein
MADETPAVDAFDPDRMRSDLTRIREKLKRLEGERLTAVASIDQAMREATDRLGRLPDAPNA